MNPPIKPAFTLKDIGAFQFYSGVMVGIGFSVVFNFLFRLGLRISSSNIIDSQFITQILEYNISSYYSLLIGYTSVGFGFCYTTYLWMSRLTTHPKKKTKHLRFAQANSLWILFTTLIFLFRMYGFFSGEELTLINDFPILGFLVPTFIYLYCWNLISRVFKSLKPFIYTSITCLLTSLILSGF